MARKHESETVHEDMEQDENKVENVVEESAPEETFNENDAFQDEADSVGEDGVPTLKCGSIVIPAPDKYLPGHVMTEDEAAHYSNFIRSRCASNMISLEKRNKRVWTAESAAEYYDGYVLGAPRGRGPTDETVRDEALEALLEEIATNSGKAIPKGKGSKDKREELKKALASHTKYAPRLAELELEIRAAYAEKNRTPDVKSETVSLDDLL